MSVSKDRLQGGDQNSSGNHIWNVGPLEILSAGRRKVPIESVCILCTHAWGAGAIFYLQVGCPNFRTLFIDINEVFIEVLRRILRTNTTTFQVHSLWGHLWQRKAAFIKSGPASDGAASSISQKSHLYSAFSDRLLLSPTRSVSEKNSLG